MSNTLTDPSKDWTPGEWVGGTVTITQGTGAGQSRGILSNTSDTLTVDAAWTIEPSGFSYKIVLSLLTGVVRGQGGTTPQIHSAGSLVLEVRSSDGYIFIVAGHPCQAVRNLKVDGVLQTGGYTIDLQNTILIPGRTLTTVAFSKTPGLVDDASAGGGDAGSGGAAIGTTVVQGIVQPRMCSVTLPPWLRGYVGWRAHIGIAILIDTGVEDLNTSPSNRVEAKLEGPNTNTTAAIAAVAPASGRCTAIAATTSVETGGTPVGSTLTFTLGPGQMPFGFGEGYDGDGVLSLLRAGVTIFPSGLVPVGSCYFTGLAVEFDFTPAQVITPEGTAVESITAGDGTTAALTPEAKLIMDILRKLTVTCDVDGYQDDSVGTITGVANRLIELPGDIDRHIGTVLLGESASIFDTASYAATRARHVALGYAHNIVINQPTSLQSLFSASARQSRCWVFSDGGKIYRIFLDAPTSPVAFIERRHFREEFPVWGSTDRTFIKSLFSMRHSLRWASGIFRVIRSSSATGGLYPTVQAIVDFPFVGPGQVMAGDLLAYDIQFFSRPHRAVQVQTFWNHMALEVGDVIGFRFPSELLGVRKWDDAGGNWWNEAYTWDEVTVRDLDPQSMSNLWVGLLFRIYRVQVNHGQNTMLLEAVEV